ncbi:hypothetical protein L1987_48037 [Smallanthus sonchifolius]|uniref:Uncharacterized protein n=1 Tax=Smallanthus sonchifolius TaxID=185202 RepID=A0ACB9FQP2_9ASTR|nr:hypothetical protein L1987_48037 [Smallanthus sonchifolius]
MLLARKIEPLWSRVVQRVRPVKNRAVLTRTRERRKWIPLNRTLGAWDDYGWVRRVSRVQLTAHGHYSGRGTSISRFSTFVALEEPITPHAKVEYTKLLINGQFVDGASGKTFPTLDTRTGQLIANVAEGDTEDANRSVSAARKAFDESPWPRMTAYVSLFFGSFFILKLGKMGSCMNRDEILLFIRLFHYYAGWADNIHGLIIQAYNSCLRASSC